LIACTQPRRIAATTVAARIADELGQTSGGSVGYKIRFQDRTDQNRYIKVVTDGILLAETQGDPWLNEYDTIIVDEAHERSLNIDFVLGILKKLVQRQT
jgi:ATP-dependent helicase HrpA